MIEITLKEEAACYYVKAYGHVGKKGNSIVCASVSVLLETWRLSELLLEQVEVTYKDGLIEGMVSKSIISEILFSSLKIGLTATAHQYPKEIFLNIGG